MYDSTIRWIDNCYLCLLQKYIDVYTVHLLDKMNVDEDDTISNGSSTNETNNEEFNCANEYKERVEELEKFTNSCLTMFDKVVTRENDELWDYVDTILRKQVTPVTIYQRNKLNGMKGKAILLLRKEIIILSREKYRVNAVKGQLDVLEEQLLENLTQIDKVIENDTEKILEWEIGIIEHGNEEITLEKYMENKDKSLKVLDDRIVELVLEKKRLENQYNQLKSRIRALKDKRDSVDIYLDRVITALEKFNNEDWNKVE